jgi:CheY-like chemotaxis protein
MARILVVDDEPLIALMAEDWLRELGHEIVGPAHDLATALGLAREECDAAIIDVTLGKDSGYEIADLLAAKGTPFIFATGHSLPAKDSRYNAVATLTKPFEFEAFQRAVQAMVGTGETTAT